MAACEAAMTSLQGAKIESYALRLQPKRRVQHKWRGKSAPAACLHSDRIEADLKLATALMQHLDREKGLVGERKEGEKENANFQTAADVFDGWRDDVLTGTPPTFYPVGTGELARIEIGPKLRPAPRLKPRRVASGSEGDKVLVGEAAKSSTAPARSMVPPKSRSAPRRKVGALAQARGEFKSGVAFDSKSTSKAWKDDQKVYSTSNSTRTQGSFTLLPSASLAGRFSLELMATESTIS